MTKANSRLQIVFDLDLAVPDGLAALDEAALGNSLGEILGPMVLQGLPTISGKQLAKSGIKIVSHRHRLAVSVEGGARPESVDMVQAAPHLTDSELERLADAFGGGLPENREDRIRALRRKALSMVSEFRLVPCVVSAKLVSGKVERLDAMLNLTNGSVMIEPKDRHHRAQAGQAGVATVEISGADVSLDASCAGHTISGPVIEVTVAQIAAHRDSLVRVWQSQV